nr:protein kinase-like domain, phloem protein 2-like protein [Tanacetum cinerariifolium]
MFCKFIARIGGWMEDENYRMKSREQRPEMSLVVEKLELALELKELHDLKPQREYEAEEMRKAAEKDHSSTIET